MSRKTKTATGIARAAWGKDTPDWVAALAKACHHSSQAAVARQLGYSPIVVSRVLRRLYHGDLTRMEQTVRRTLMDGKVAVPARKHGPAAGQRMTKSSAEEVARAAWGKVMPIWVAALARGCAAQSQTRMARKIGYSPAVISQVLRNCYRGDMVRVERAVRGALMGETVMCPVVGKMAADVCLTHQKRGFTNSSSFHNRLYRACRGGCPNYLGGRDDNAH